MYRRTDRRLQPVALARSVALALALAPLALGRATASQFTPPTIPAFANGEQVQTIATDASDPATAAALGVNLSPPLTNAIGHATSSRYQVTNFAQPPVLSQVPQPVGPGNTNLDYSPLWQVFHVTWNAGTAPKLLSSEKEVLAAQRAGKVTVAATNTVINGPVVGTPEGGSLLPVTEIDGFSEGDAVQTLITDASDAGFAAMTKSNYAPKLARALGTGAELDLYKFFDDRHNPAQGTVFNTHPDPPGPANSNATYTPIWNVVPIRFLPNVMPPFPLITSAAQLDRLEKENQMSEGPDPGIAVSCPIVGVGKQVGQG